MGCAVIDEGLTYMGEEKTPAVIFDDNLLD
jgi:hypothetical protein